MTDTMHYDSPLGKILLAADEEGMTGVWFEAQRYFAAKLPPELISATVESVWCEIFHRPQDEAVFQDVQTCVKWMYERMAYGDEQYPGFFTLHSLGFMQEDKADGKRQMQQIWHHILNGLCTVLQQDTKIRPGAFNEQFTVEKFADVLFSLMLSALLRQDYDPAAVLEIVRRTLY